MTTNGQSENVLESSKSFLKVLYIILKNSRNFWTILAAQEYSRRILGVECESRIFSKTNKFKIVIVLITEAKFLRNNGYFLFVLGITD